MTSTTEPTRVAEDHSGDDVVRAARTGDLVIPTAVACIAAVVTSLWGLEDRALWLDEATSVGATNALLETLRATAANMGLYYVLLDGWTAVLGTSVWTVRALSVVFAVLTIVAFRPVASRLLGRRAAVAALGGLALAPGLTRYAQEARSYALVMLLTTLCWWCTTRAVETHHTEGPGAARRWWLSLALIAPFGILAHGLFILQLIGVAASLLVIPTRRPMLRACCPAFLTAGIVLAVLASMGAQDIADWVPPLAWSQMGDLVEELIAPSGIVAAALLVFISIGAVHALGLHDRPTDPIGQWRRRMPIAWGLVPPALLTVLSIARPYLIPRYVVASVPGLVLLTVVGASVALDRFHRCRLPRNVKAGAGATVVAMALVWGQVAVHQRPAPNWRGSTAQVADDVRPGDAVLFPFTPIRKPFEAAWRELGPHPVTPKTLWTPRPLGDVHRFDTITDADHIRENLTGVDRIWIVHQLTHNGGHTPLQVALDLEPLRTQFTIAERTSYDGGIEIVLLERR